MAGEEGTTSLIWAGITGRGAGRATSVTGRTVVLSCRRVSLNHALKPLIYGYDNEISMARKHTCKAS